MLTPSLKFELKVDHPKKETPRSVTRLNPPEKRWSPKQSPKFAVRATEFKTGAPGSKQQHWLQNKNSK